MCITAFAWQVLPDNPLFLISNRDEFYHREALPLAEWVDSQIIAGQDVSSQGTWLGISKQGKWAIITNFREPNTGGVHERSRGLLVTDYLNGSQSPMQFAQSLAAVQDYAGFNLVVGDLQQAVVFSNRGTPPTLLGSGVYTLSNGLISDSWPKMERLRLRSMQELLPRVQQQVAPDYRHAATTSLLQDDVLALAWQVLQDEQQANDADLPHTGISADWEKLLSSVFIQTPMYGTRVSSVLLLEKKGYQFIEKTHVPVRAQSVVSKCGYWPDTAPG